jgi:hypothetical protein
MKNISCLDKEDVEFMINKAEFDGVYAKLQILEKSILKCLNSIIAYWIIYIKSL